MIENIRLSFRGIASHKLRSFLTMLGIIIGIASIIAIVSLINGTNEQIRRNVIGAGDDTVTVRLQQSDWEYDMSSGIPDGISPVTSDEMNQLAAIDHVTAVSKYNSRSDYDGVYRLDTSLSGGYVYGVDDGYFPTAGYAVTSGRAITGADVTSKRHVAVLDDTAVQLLYASEDPLGTTVEIKGVPFQIVGVVRQKVEFEPTINSVEDYYTYYDSMVATGHVYVPQSLWPTLYQYDEPESVVLKTDGTDSLTQVGKAAADILNAGIVSSDSSSAGSSDSADSQVRYAAKDLQEQARQIQELSQGTNRMLIWIAAISLLVGGIGVMNIMLVSVTERTREIGLKKAIGAKRRAIMGQFLTEAVVLTSLGGLLGVAVGIALAYVIGRMNSTPVAISVPASVVAVVFSMLIGIVFGLLPSRRAANLDPIEALRRE